MHPSIRTRALSGLVLLVFMSRSMPLAAQDEQAQKPFKTEEIEQLVAPIALYPDSLLGADVHGIDVSARIGRDRIGRPFPAVQKGFLKPSNSGEFP